MKTLALASFFACASMSLAQNVVISPEQAQQQAELNGLFSTLETNYGPLTLKNTTIGLDFEKLKSESFGKLATLKDSSQYYFLIADILNSLNDAHVSVELPSSLAKGLPLQFSNIRNKVILNYIEPASTFKNTCGLKVGDELIEINGVSLDAAQASSLAFNKDGNALTNRSVFAMSLSSMQESQGIDLIYSPVFGTNVATLVLKDVEKGFRKVCPLEYKVSGFTFITKDYAKTKEAPSEETAEEMIEEKIEELQAYINAAAPSEENNSLTTSKTRKPFLFSKSDKEKLAQIYKFQIGASKLVNLSYSSALKAVSSEEKADAIETALGKKIELGHKRPLFKLPKSFRRLRVPFSGTNLFVGTFRHGKKIVGYIRIPSYEAKNLPLAVLGLRAIMTKLEQQTDFLIVDQMNNPGGEVIYSDLIVKSLVGDYDEGAHMKFAVTPTQDFIRWYVNSFEAVLNDPQLSPDVEKKALGLKVLVSLEKIMTAHQNGDDLSAPVSMTAISEHFESMLDGILKNFLLRSLAKAVYGKGILNEHAHYTKPVYMLINELDFSGGDATPAILQDYGRAKLIGTRTAGAGGTVDVMKNTMFNSFSYSLTTSLMVRKDGSYVENYGVQPDLHFELDEKDIVENYANTLERLMKVIDADSAKASLQ